MSKTITIPECRSPFVVIINGTEYVFESGQTVELPDEVAEVIQFHVDSKPKPKPVEEGDSDGSYADGYEDGYEQGKAEGGGNAVPTTPTDGRTDLGFWYQYLSKYWTYSADPETWETVVSNGPVEELAFPTGTQDVTELYRFTRVYCLYDDGMMSMFEEKPVLTKRFTGVLDLPKYSGHANQLFAWISDLREVGVIKMPLVKLYEDMFLGCSALETVQYLDLTNATTAWGMFTYCESLKHVGITGTISVDKLGLDCCPMLAKETIVNFIYALSTATTGLTMKFSLTAVNNAFETSAGLADGSTSAEWLALVASRSNWTIALA